MNVINEQCNSITPLIINFLAFLLALFPKLIVKLHEEQHLVSNIREKVIFSD